MLCLGHFSEDLTPACTGAWIGACPRVGLVGGLTEFVDGGPVGFRFRGLGLAHARLGDPEYRLVGKQRIPVGQRLQRPQGGVELFGLHFAETLP